MNRKHILISAILFIGLAAVFYHFFVVVLPPHSATRLDGNGGRAFIENRTDKPIMKVNFHIGSQEFKSSRTYKFSGVYSYAPKRAEVILKNDIEFTVLFPYESINSSENETVNNAISAHVFVALQKAAAKVGDDFYDKETRLAYPKLLAKYLNEASPAVNDFYFTDVDISKILYAPGGEIQDKDIQKFLVNCQAYLTASQTLSDNKAHTELAALNSQFKLRQSLDN